ncbi:BRI1 kinase inhibitor 1-like [Cucurbita pepo subsp. pepo]|uniref:BRI1 kinase inhibitor 1-like n=1 Tax=Cucurbita pepo subsp. pepo TaxID=3664 RepID=UPI000C9D652D|nr:BRI1 kinase inhibitor 1-like [Cucurbita pepo subsp. pepo]
MDIHRHQKIKEKYLEEQSPASSSPSSASSSPSHEFSFSVSLQTDKTKTPSSFTIDLSPADDIFFHGHLLPLHFLSHSRAPPHCSTNSVESSALPIGDLPSDKEPNKEISNFTNCKSDEHYQNSNRDTREKHKSRSFSLLGLRWRKGYEVEEEESKEKHLKQKFGFNFSHLLKRYTKMVRPFLHPRGRRDDMQQLHGQSYSFSGNFSFRNKPEQGGRRGELSAPVSKKTSPTNTTLPPSNNDSKMEELQTAIQAAISHCKTSILKEES